MKFTPRILFWIIIVLTVMSILIDLPKTINIAYESPKIPLINKKISINKEITGFNSGFFLKPFNIKKDFIFRRGLDLEGGTSITLKADMKDALIFLEYQNRLFKRQL